MFGFIPSSESGFLKLAILSFGPDVAPHFSAAREILFYVIHEGRVRLHVPLQVVEQSLQQKLEKVLALGAQVLVCGAIEKRARAFLERRGVKVLSDWAGPVADIVRHFLR